MVIDNEVFDQEVFAEFAPKIVEAVQAHGGRFIMRGGQSEAIEGDWTPQRIVVMEFDSFERAQAFVRSDDYTSLNELRSRCMHSKVIVVEGYDGPGS